MIFSRARRSVASFSSSTPTVAQYGLSRSGCRSRAAGQSAPPPRRPVWLVPFGLPLEGGGPVVLLLGLLPQGVGHHLIVEGLPGADERRRRRVVRRDGRVFRVPERHAHELQRTLDVVAPRVEF